MQRIVVSGVLIIIARQSLAAVLCITQHHDQGTDRLLKLLELCLLLGLVRFDLLCSFTTSVLDTLIAVCENVEIRVSLRTGVVPIDGLMDPRAPILKRTVSGLLHDLCSFLLSV